MRWCILGLVLLSVGVHSRSVSWRNIPEALLPANQSFNFRTLRICAFNIQTFGKAKMNKPEVVEILKRILIQYDITLIQEIRDIDEIAIYDLLDVVNSASPDDPYEVLLSERLGRSSRYKEQYAYMYRPSKFAIVKTYQWPEDREGNDWFERPPYNVHFKANGYTLGDFVYSGIHVKPGNAVTETDHLVDVFDGMADIWGSENPGGWIIGGDLNAGCNYVKESDWPSIRLRTQRRFNWVIGDELDTAVSPNNNCPYDRFVLTGHVSEAFVDGTAKVFNFQEAYGLDYEQTKAVSDHWPIVMDSR